MNQKRNQGYQRTHRNIRECVYRLLQEKPVEQITIGEICQKVGINRSTFYAHFQDVYEVMELINEELNEELVEQYQRKALADQSEGMGPLDLNRRDYMLIHLEHLRKYDWFYLMLLRDPSNILMQQSIRALQKDISDPLLRQVGVDEKDAIYYFRFVTAGFFAVIQQWLEGGCREEPERIAMIIENMQPAMPKNVFAYLWEEK